MSTELSEHDQNKLLQSIEEFDAVVFKRYLDKINQFDLVPLTTSIESVITNTRVRKLTRIVYDRDEDNLHKFNSVFSALHSSNSTMVLILKAERSHTDIYLCTYKAVNQSGLTGYDAMETLEAAMRGNFPGVDISTNLFNKEIYSLLNTIQSSEMNAIANVVGVPSQKGEDAKTFSQGLEKLIEGMRGREYTAVIQATPVSRTELEQIEVAYQKIYTTLSVFEQKQLSLTENQSRSLGVSLTKGFTQTVTNTVSDTQTSTQGTNYSKAKGNTETRSNFDIKRAAAGAAAGALAGGITANVPGAAVGAIVGLASGMFGGSTSDSSTITEGKNESFSSAKGTTKSDTEAVNKGKTDSYTMTAGSAQTMQVTEKNRYITSLLELIDNQLKRIEECKNFGMWNWGAYFVGKDELDVRLGADLYSGMLRGDMSGLERSAIGVWRRDHHPDTFHEMQKYVTQLKHPILKAPDGFSTKLLSPTSLISTKEMAVAMGLPNKSLPGIPVFDSVAFGRSVTRLNSQINESISIGKIFNFGAIDSAHDVELDLNSLTSHVFVTGSTGAGKSNVIYSILSELSTQKKIPFLIIEPAKGEYKSVFGGCKDVNVFGTNAKLTPLLRVNPFSFPEEIHVMEHVDRLIEILNAVWPMYAAMPAILKEAVELTYERCGWDLLNSECAGSSIIFPDFYDLLMVLPEIINQSDYSQEMKGNYAGALLTRVKSLTNGYFSTIFDKDELSPSILFDESCIVDLSRVGSSETKSLLMGILFLKLQEYRMATASGSNSSLKHITVLEEAHNLLRRTSLDQGQESANLQGKSVEMISNAIAEMRTFGESFIIADQAPGLLDPSVIRNTNTKIILRLPDFEDRNLVGKAAHLTEDQIDELARLETGCAAVFQNNWLEPVLCQFNRFNDNFIQPFAYEAKSVRLVDQRKLKFTQVVKLLISDFMDNEARRFNSPEDYTKQKINIHQKVIDSFGLPMLLDGVPMTQNIDLWIRYLAEKIFADIDKTQLKVNEQNELMVMVLDVLAAETPHNRPFFEAKKIEIRNQQDALL
ncbi:ATP-binding protein [Providencia stuartii]|uniref:ATP-binding protein n=1 Tax=Providencia stuartii TaxID=588 RepID=UPI0034E5CDB1